MTTWTVGIDPGATGAVAVLNARGVLAAVHDMPYADGQVIAPLLAEIIAEYIDPLEAPSNSVTCWVEQVRSRPGQSAPAMWKFATGYGVILGVVGALGVRTKHVTPNAWKKAMKLTADKGRSRRLACEQWPADAALFARAKDDGRAEAALIAEYGRRQELHP
jgi:crossover junction endodeoxyribonuclease RuvC